MITVLKKLISGKDPVTDITLKFIQILNIPVTETSTRKQLLEHPDYPSLLAINDVLNNYGIETLAVRIDSDKLGQIEPPFIAEILITDNIKKGNNNQFTIVQAHAHNTVTILDPERNVSKTIKKNEFKSLFTGNILLAEVGDQTGEKDYAVKHKAEKRKFYKTIFSISLIPAIALISGLNFVFENGWEGTWQFLNILLTLSGLSVAFLLLWYELDKHNPALKELCTAGKKTNCSAVLQSKASKIFGISWSQLGFIYFTGYLLVLLVGSSNPGVLFLLAWLSFLVFPYIFFSVFYQWKISKQWCLLCLCVQAILFFQAILCLSSGWYSSSILLHTVNFQDFLILAISFSLPLSITLLGLPILRQAKEGKISQTQLIRLKNDTFLFESLLQKESKVAEGSEGLGLTLGNPNAKYKIIKVCNPYCEPCAKAHLKLESLLASGTDIQLQIIFTASNDDGDPKAAPVRHLMALAEKGDNALLGKALDDWYNAQIKDYVTFASKYVMNGELKKQGEKLKAMRDWCTLAGISSTPTIYINRHKLPAAYCIDDLKYLLKN